MRLLIVLTRGPNACSEVGIFIQVPQGVRAKELDISIQPCHLRIGIKGLPPYLDVRLFGRAVVMAACCCCEHALPIAAVSMRLVVCCCMLSALGVLS